MYNELYSLIAETYIKGGEFISKSVNIVCILNYFVRKKGSESMCNTNFGFIKVLKKFFVVLLSVVAFVLVIPSAISCADTRGRCGDNLTWVLDDSGNLTITGTGEMYDYDAATFWDRSRVRQVDIQAGVTSIGNAAFSNCVNLEVINMPNGLTRIGVMAFRDCVNLFSFVIPNNVTLIEEETFSGCINLAKCIAHNNITSVGRRAFYSCERLGCFNIPVNVTNIGDEAFYCCSRLPFVVIPNSVTHVGNFAFFGCAKLAYATVPPHVNVGVGVFNCCDKLVRH